MPTTVRRFIAVAVIVLAVAAAIGNFSHVFDFAHSEDHGGQGGPQAALAAILPDVLLVLCVMRLRYDRRSVSAWVGLLTAVTAVVWASVATADPTWTARAVAIWPVLVAIIAACLMEARPDPVTVAAPTAVNPPRPARPRPVTPANPVPAPAVTAQVTPQVTPTLTPVRPKVAAAAEPKARVVAVIPGPGSKEDRVTTVAEWVREDQPWAQMNRAIQDQWGVSPATAKRDIEAARAQVAGS